MSYEIFKSIPHERVITSPLGKDELFTLYKCGVFTGAEHLELVELEANAEYTPHYHKFCSAVLYIILGNGKLFLKDKYIDYSPSQKINIPAEQLHGFITETKTLFLSIQTPSIIDSDGKVDIYYEHDHANIK